MIVPAMDSLSNSVKEQNDNKFGSVFTLLTATCKDCHKATNYGFNVIKIPDTPPFSNQVFKPE